MKEVLWRVFCESAPSIVKYCKKCGGESVFSSSGLFRMNAQGRRLDVWLIYNCEKCKTSWNSTVFSRVSPEKLGQKMLQQLESNSPALALKIGTDCNIAKINGVQMGKPTVHIDGDSFTVGEQVLLQIGRECDMPLKLADIICEKLAISKSAWRKLVQLGRVTSIDGLDLNKGKLPLKTQIVFWPE